MVRPKGVVVKNASLAALAAAAARKMYAGSPPPQPVEKRRKKRSKFNSSKKKDVFSTYIFRVLKQIHPDGMTISANAMSTMNSMMKDLFERITRESANLVKYTKRATLSPRDVQMACRLILPGELAKHAISEGTKAVSKFFSST